MSADPNRPRRRVDQLLNEVVTEMIDRAPAPEPTISDEELATLKSEPHHWCTKGQWTDTFGYGSCSCGKDKRDAVLDRLIAALRAKTEEARKLRVEADAMGEIAREWEAEVERLRGMCQQTAQTLDEVEDERDGAQAEVVRLRTTMMEHVRRDWRAVTADGGITFSQREGDYGEHNYKARENVDAWIARHPDYGGGMHLECWEQRWSSTPAVWEQIPVATPNPPAEVDHG